MATNNDYLGQIAESLGQGDDTGVRILNNEYLRRISEGIGGIVKPETGKVDANNIDGVIPAANLPSFVDDVVEGYLYQGDFYSDSQHTYEIAPEAGKIYVDLSADTSYRWGGSSYVAIGRTLDAASQAEAEAGQDNAKYMTSLRTRQAIDALSPTDLGITGATVGQYPQVAAVDSDGAPTEWTAASGYTLPVMSADVRGGAKIQPDSGLEIAGTDNLQVRLALESDGDVRGGLAQVTAKGHAEQVTTTGKNLLDESLLTNTLEWAYTSVQLSPNTTYVCSSPDAPDSYVDSTAPRLYVYNNSSGADRNTVVNSSHQSVVTTDETGIAKVQWKNGNSTNNLTDYHFQLELGSTATDYEPYTGGLPSPRPDWEQPIEVVTGHTITGKTGRYVDLVVKQGNTTLSTTPIPLPSRGWVAGLPDGTADVLTLDGAGKVTWERKTDEVVLDGSEDEAWVLESPRCSLRDYGRLQARKPVSSLVATDSLCTHFMPKNGYETLGSVVGFSVSGNESLAFCFNDGTDTMTVNTWKVWLSENPVTVLYPLDTPVTEDCGYCEDWPTDIPDSATVSIPELDAVGVKYFIDSGVTELARQWYERAHSEYENRLEALESAVAELVAGA